MSEALSDEQFAEHIAKEGGGSVGFFSRKPVEGQGFMTAVAGHERDTEHPISASDIASYRQSKSEIAAQHPNSAHGAWGTVQDVSVQTKSPREATELGKPVGEQAAYALPQSRMSARGHHASIAGKEVLFHTEDLGKNDVDPRYRPGALDMPGGAGSFTRNQYENKDWQRKGGRTRNLETGKMESVSYGDVLRKINENRAMSVRESIGRKEG